MAMAMVQLLLLLHFFILHFVLAISSSSSSSSSFSVCQSLEPTPPLRPFIDPLSFPPVIHLSNASPLTISAYKISQKLHSELPETTLYAYGTSQDSATYPGPTLVAKQNVAAYITWMNQIPDETHMLKVDETLEWANPSQGGVPTVTHLHGAEVESIYDGHPNAWFTPSGETGPTFHSQNYTYLNQQPAAALWYHDHTLGITRLNVASGLSGMYIITSEQEVKLNLPLGIPLILQDRQFYPNGSINFPNLGIIPVLHPQWCPEYFGDTIVVNGVIWPYLKVFPRAYRFRILNGCSARFFVLSLNGSTLYQIGTDGGFVEGDRPWNRSRITMAPAERVDVIIDFSEMEIGEEVVMENSGDTPYPTGELAPRGALQVIKFMVVEEGGEEEGMVELPLLDMAELQEKDEKKLSVEDVVVMRRLSVVEYDDENHMPQQFTLENKTWTDPVEVIPTEGQTEMWELMNLRINGHPLHIHLSSFQVLNQQIFSSQNYESGSCSFDVPYPEDGTCFQDYPVPPNDYQRGWKDTVILLPGIITRLLVRFSLRNGSAFPFDPSVGPGYIWHCHIVDHEDNVMMRPFKVTRNSTSLSLLLHVAGHGHDQAQAPTKGARSTPEI